MPRKKGTNSRRLMALAFIGIMAFGSLAYGLTLLMGESYPVPPKDVTIEQIRYTFDCPGRAIINSAMMLSTTPEGFPLEGGEGVQFLAEYRYPRVMVMIAFMKFDNSTAARRIGEKIADYAANFTANYTSWECDVGGDEGHARFEYPGLTWEMWYSGDWVIELIVGESGGIGRRIADDMKACIAQLPARA